jgi:regulator of replication initiation timing
MSDNAPKAEVNHFVKEVIRLGDAVEQLAIENEKLKKENEVLRKLVNDIDLSLRIPAAEFVPAISDVFTLIDKALEQADKIRGEV